MAASMRFGGRWGAAGTLLAVLAAAAGCGRLGFDARAEAGPAPGDDGPPPLDASGERSGSQEFDGARPEPSDGGSEAESGPASLCPGGMVHIVEAGAAPFCVDELQRGSLTWLRSREACVAAGFDLCAEWQWAAACQSASGRMLDDMTDDWEWTVDIVSEGVARKRGSGSCSGVSSHDIGNGSYGFRCCSEPTR